MEKLLEAVKTAIWEAAYASGSQSNNAHEALKAIEQLEAENALFDRKYAVYAKRQVSPSSLDVWAVVAIATSKQDAHTYMRQAGEETFCQEIMVAK